VQSNHCLIVAVMAILSGCAGTNAMHVTKGLSPKYSDDKVVFQTTYFFRVFDYCARTAGALNDKSQDYAVIPQTDALYRYRMTGKANALASHIRFESGVLKSYEIDPFGVQVEYDKSGGGFRPVSPQEVDARAAQGDRLEGIRQLRRLRDDLVDGRDPPPTDDPALNQVNKSLGELVAAYARGYGDGTSAAKPGPDNAMVSLKLLKSLAPNGSDSKTPVDQLIAIDKDVYAKTVSRNDAKKARDEDTGTDKTATENAFRIASIELRAAQRIQAMVHGSLISKDEPLDCAQGITKRKGFQIIGPEGWRTFNQDERLLMAMHSNAAPLLGSMKELSGRALNGNVSPEALVLPLVKEQLAVTKSAYELEKTEISIESVQGGNALQQFIDKFKNEGGSK